MPPDSKETELGSSNHEASLSAGKNTGVVLVPCQTCKYVPSYFRWCGYSRRPWVSFVTTDEFSARVTKVTPRVVVSWTYSLPFRFWPLFWFDEIAISKVRKSGNFELHSSLKLSFTKIQGILSKFFGCKSFLNQALLIFLLYLRQTRKTQSILANSL